MSYLTKFAVTPPPLVGRGLRSCRCGRCLATIFRSSIFVRMQQFLNARLRPARVEVSWYALLEGTVATAKVPAERSGRLKADMFGDQCLSLFEGILRAAKLEVIDVDDKVKVQVRSIRS